MNWMLYVLLALAVLGDILLAVLLVRSGRRAPKGDTADDIVRAMTPVLQSETDLLAEQLRAGGNRPYNHRQPAGFFFGAG